MVLLIYLIGKLSISFKRLSNFLNKIFIWNFLISFYFSQFTPIVLGYLLNLRRISHTSRIESVSIYISYALIVLITIILIFLFIQIKKKYERDSNSVSPITEGLRRAPTFCLYWRLLTLLRLYIILICLVFLQHLPSFQIVILLVFSLLTQILLLKLKPFSEQSQQRIELFNEVMNSIYLYALLWITLNNDLSLREAQGWFLVAVCLSVVAVNICYLLSNVLSKIKTWCLRKR